MEGEERSEGWEMHIENRMKQEANDDNKLEIGVTQIMEKVRGGVERGSMIKMRRDALLEQQQWGGKREGSGKKSESLSSTAELSDLVCYRQELSEAKAKITEALFTHTPRQTCTHRQS